MSEKISISLNDHEQLLMDIRTLTDSATSLATLLTEVVEALPNLSKQGEFHNRLDSGELSLNRYVSKAQAFQSLAELLFLHTQATYQALINTDRILAQDIANQVLNDPQMQQEVKDYIREHPEEAVSEMQNAVANGEIDLEGMTSEDIIISSGRMG